MDQTEIKYFIEAALLASGRPLSVDQLQNLFDGRSAPSKADIRSAISTLVDEYEDRGITISEVASGFRIQVTAGMAERLHKLWEERPPRYSRALFETLALIAYRQPITRGEIEDVRGVSVSPNIVRTLLDRDWVRVVGHRDVPGRPEMFGTTRTFLDYFGLKKLDDLPPLADLSDGRRTGTVPGTRGRGIRCRTGGQRRSARCRGTAARNSRRRRAARRLGVAGSEQADHHCVARCE
jgi:segregation and condensation protein B